MRWIACFLILLSTARTTCGDDAQAAKDATIVETLLRLKTVDVNSNPKLKDAVLRHLELHKGTPKYVDLIERLNLRGVEEALLQLALADPASTEGVRAGELLLKRGQAELIAARIDGDDEDVATKAISLLGYVDNKDALEILKPLALDDQRSRPLRTAAANALGRSRLGERYLLRVVQDGRLPADLNFTVANVLYASSDDAIRIEVAKHLTLPATAGSKPLPPVAELAKRSGDAAHGQELFKTKATCIKCHKVRGEGKEVGPDLSEIGSKLSREAMFVSILDPSAGISHNYETYTAVLDSGNIISGLKVSETDDSITIRSAESIDKVIAKSEIEEIVKSTISLMPADLQKTMSEQELVDVVDFISTLKKTAS
ncbi:MAG: c-type cytochrome [Planctomycetota bacterium]|nr:c-type cytochrome [Planctomycetota bacterium]